MTATNIADAQLLFGELGEHWRCVLMKLFLMRHGHAVAAEKERPLTEQGRKEAVRVGEFLCKIKEMPDVILHSGLTRSRETAEGVAASLGFHGDLPKQDGLEPEDSATAFMADFRAKYDPSALQTLLIVGHEPFISDFAGRLLTGGKTTFPLNFSRGTLLGMEYSAQRWQLLFYLTGENLSSLIWVP
jgi:phosphohistidine phosphatase